MTNRCRMLMLLLLALPAAAAGAREIAVSSDAELREAVRDAKPGDRIKLAEGEYQTLRATRLAGRPGKPIVIESADPAKPARFLGRRQGIHLVEPAHVVLRRLVVSRQSANGINIDDGGSHDTPAHHVVLEGLQVERIGPKGNFDGIKLSGLNHFTIRDCEVTGWGGSAIDMVGCHEGLIEESTFRGRDDHSQASGVQMKGGTSRVRVERCLFVGPMRRGVNLGGSTGLQLFRPDLAEVDPPWFEARDCVVAANRFIGTQAPVAFVTQTDCAVRYNTIYRPQRWVLRILQETGDQRFLQSRRGTFEHNVVVWQSKQLHRHVNVGPDTEPGTFRFNSNVWYCEDRPGQSAPRLPVDAKMPGIGRDPQFRNPADEDLTITDPPIAKIAGPHAMPDDKPEGETQAQ